MDDLWDSAGIPPMRHTVRQDRMTDLRQKPHFLRTACEYLDMNLAACYNKYQRGEGGSPSSLRKNSYSK